MIEMKLRRRGKGIRQKLKLFVSGRARAVAQEAVASTLLELIDEGFDNRSDPYGFSWAPHVIPVDHEILEDTRALREGFYSVVLGNEVSIQNAVGYAGVHQAGSARIPRRAMLPYGPLPAPWSERIDQNVAFALKLL